MRRTFLLRMSKADFADVQKDVEWMAVWMKACLFTNLRRFSRHHRQQKQQHDRHLAMLFHGRREEPG